MSDYEYILKQARKFHYSKWTDEELRKCVDMLPNLSREELTTLIMSKWTRDAKILRESRIKNLDTDALIEEFKDKKSGNVALVRKEMQNRFMENKDCDKIAEAFNASVEKDKQWVKSHEKKRKEEQ